MKRIAYIILTLILIQTACEKNFSDCWPYTVPPRLEDGIETASLSDVNIDENMIHKAVGRIQQQKYSEVHSMLIAKNNTLVFEDYYTGHQYQWDAPWHHGQEVTWNRSMKHNQLSVTKSITSLCTGIAIMQGHINSVHQSIFDYLPDYLHFKSGTKENITIENLLTMTSGLEWDEWGSPYSSISNDMIGMYFSNVDPVSYVLSKPMASEPGTNFTYSGGNCIILGEIIKNASGKKLDEYAREYLFEPLGTNSFTWPHLKDEVIQAAGDLKITPRDMIKIGMMFLNDGYWNEWEIISPSWVEQSAIPYYCNHGINVPGEASGKMGYSYSWWTQTFSIKGRKISMYTASGWGGQHIMIFPEIETVVVFTGGNYLTKRPPFEILERFILPAII